MNGLLDRIARIPTRHLAGSPVEVLALMIARRLEDEEHAGRYVLIARRAPEAALLEAYQKAVKAGPRVSIATFWDAIKEVHE